MTDFSWNNYTLLRKIGKKWQKMEFPPLRKMRFQKKITGNLLKAYPFSSMKSLPAQGIKFEILNKKLNNKHSKTKHATYNKDNRSNLFVTVFADYCSEPASCKLAVSGCPHLPAIKSCTVSYYWLRSSLYRDTAPAVFEKDPAPEVNSIALKFVPRHSTYRIKLYHDGKNRAMHSRPTALEKV